MEQNMAVTNKVAKARGLLAQGMDSVAGDAGGELGSVRHERRTLMKRLGWLPVSASDFSRRDDSGDRQWNKVSQALQELTVEADKLGAIVNGLKRVLAEGGQYGVNPDAATRERFRLEIEANERDLEGYRKRIQEYRDGIDMGRAQSGFGDQRYVDDDQVRARFRELFAREVALVAGGKIQATPRVRALDSTPPTLARADTLELSLDTKRSEMERTAAEGRRLKRRSPTRSSALESHSARLDQLDQEAPGRRRGRDANSRASAIA
jgi:hypothetical protein